MGIIGDIRTKKEGSVLVAFIPGGHGAMLGIPEDPNLGKVLRRAKD